MSLQCKIYVIFTQIFAFALIVRVVRNCYWTNVTVALILNFTSPRFVAEICYPVVVDSTES